jgi:type I restriction-modification system DNA methylase subunit
MGLFQKSVLTEYLKKQDSIAVENAYKKFVKYFYNPITQQNIRDINEEGFQQKFLMELFVNCFGYVINPDPYYNLTTEFKNLKDAKKADGAILIDSKAIAVIELKGTNTKNLEKCRQQAFDYKSNHPTCKYVITSNFEKLRFYINTSDEFEEFNLFTLTEKQFALLYLCVFSENLLNNTPLEIKKASTQEEEAITKKLYTDYSYFRKEIFSDLINSNPEYDKLLLFNKTQKLLDRFLFIFFSEDRGLIPANSIGAIINKWEEDKSFYGDRTLFEVFKGYFNVLNVGRPARGEKQAIFAYNGGLFADDEVLNKLKIDDNILLKHTKNLSHYDFESEVSVNILGHIFEHSLSEIEEIQNEISGLETGTSKRKKDGIFYTPQYITKYIVENTVGKLCQEKKNELEIYEEVYTQHKARSQKRIDNLNAYRDWLLGLTICDPACGSGAFLIEALNFLIDEHKYIDELNTAYHGASIPFSDISSSILENNLYGVDINEESVEIAKLSLWLRTAERGRKLTSLSNNLKCGNSLIDDPEVAGDKAFNWQSEFPEVFAKGGFDIVIGNPPYVVLSSFDGDEFSYLQDNYKTAYGRLNLFSLFIEKCTEIVKPNGVVGLIIPDSLCLIDYYSKLRKLLLDDYTINGLIELGDGVFDDATVPALILLFENKPPVDNLISTGTNKDILLGFEKPNLIKQEFYYRTPKNSFNLYADEIFVKLNEMIEDNKASALKDVLQIKIGVCTGGNKKHLNEKPIYQNSKKVLQGKNIHRYKLNWGEMYINYSKPELLRSRDEAIFLKEEKLLMRQTSDKLILSYDDEQYYTIDSLFIIYRKDEELNLKYCLALLNSKLLNRQYQKLNPEIGRVFAQVKIDYVNEIPIIKTELNKQNEFVILVDILIDKTRELDKVEMNFSKYFSSQFNIEKLPRKLQDWYELEFGDYIKELNKTIKKSGGEKLTKMDEMEWMEVFETKKSESQKLKDDIDKIDKEIDQMVYELYGLTKEEIEIVENISL